MVTGEFQWEYRLENEEHGWSIGHRTLRAVFCVFGHYWHIQGKLKDYNTLVACYNADVEKYMKLCQ